jgi:hypothetical protein
MSMSMFAHVAPVVRRDAELVEGAAAAVVLVAFISMALGAAAVDVARLVVSAVALASG